MTTIFAALMLFGISVYTGSLALDGWRAGAMRAPFTGRINPIVFSRLTDPLAFWLAAAIQTAIALGLAGAGVMVLIVGVTRK